MFFGIQSYASIAQIFLTISFPSEVRTASNSNPQNSGNATPQIMFRNLGMNRWRGSPSTDPDADRTILDRVTKGPRTESSNAHPVRVKVIDCSPSETINNLSFTVEGDTSGWMPRVSESKVYLEKDNLSAGPVDVNYKDHYLINVFYLKTNKYCIFTLNKEEDGNNMVLRVSEKDNAANVFTWSSLSLENGVELLVEPTSS
ncbi:hypothetical protein ENBRE01_0980 [Enteropsectra breve]|nr:hypothetical protein ENBRE01_0980 [Enteropsectra breve]